jgi:hypothetical protein
LHHRHRQSDLYVRCAEAFLEDDETVDAEVFLNKVRVPHTHT